MYTIEQYFEVEDLSENTDRILELIDGKIVESSYDFTPSHIAASVAGYIGMYPLTHELGYITGDAGGYVMDERNVFCPDVGYISKVHLPKMPEREALVPPDFAVEVKSLDGSKRAMRRKAETYLAPGTKLVWLVFPAEDVVEVYMPDMDVQSISYDGVLDGGDVLPGFTLKVAEVFGPKEQ